VTPRHCKASVSIRLTQFAALKHGSERRRFRDDGFSLMEVVVSLGVFAVIATAGAGSLIKTMNTSADNRERVRAANLAGEEIEKTRAAFRVAPATVVDDLDAAYDVPVDLDGTTQLYSVVRDVTWLNGSGIAAPGLDATNGELLRVEVRVRWQSLEPGRPAVINTTVLS
jgi:prepilin-type N-terminal cleavage/methylation domain-containing protein